MGYSKLFSIFFLFFIFTTFAPTASLNRSHKCPEEQSESLLLFKHNLSSINYPNDYCSGLSDYDYRPKMMSWNKSIDCCNWDGVRCDNPTGDVIHLNLFCGMLQGTIHPDSLFNLDYLTSLDLSYNKLNGTLPSWLFTSPFVEDLSLDGNMFSGNVPWVSLNTSHKCSKKQSESLLLFKHNLSSTNYPNDYCSGLSDYDYRPKMMSWNKSIDCCNWDGVRCDNSTGDVIRLNLFCGMLQGTIHPDSLFNLDYLTSLDLSYNKLNGTLPSWLFTSPFVEDLSLDGNMFSGNVPWVSLNTSHKCSEKQSEALLLFKHNLSSTNYPNDYCSGLSDYDYRPKMMSWNKSIDCCNWDGVRCDNSTGDVIRLNLFCGMLQGTIHPDSSLFNLTHLTSLDLGSNDFTGNIPSEISFNLTHLTYLKLSRNKLNGTLPSWLFTSPSLEVLFLDNNMFSGNVPFESFSLPSLKYLYLNKNNQLAGQIDVQTFRKFTNLTRLRLSSNNFSGELELDTFLSSLTNLVRLDLSYNGFTVTTNNTNHYVNPGFERLFLASCKLKVFPNSLRAMKQLRELDLSSNEIHGQIPHWAGEIGSTYGLEYLNLQSNLIEGPFPPSICNMSDLYSLDMSNNRFGGSIPQCFGNITSSLEMVDMGNNRFQGTIPNIYWDCGNLEGIILKGNHLEGELPSSLSKCQSLKVVDFGKNHLNGTFPGWLGALPNLQVLVLKSNNFHGHIQTSATVDSPFPSLRVLDLSHNGFVGQLPAKYFQNFNSMKNVVKKRTKPEYLDMGDEEYYSFVVAVKGVNQDFPKISVDYTIIDLSNNTIEGEIPDVIGGLNSLIVLNISHNCLKGPIPHALGNLTEIESLDLSWNQLTGEIPESLAGIKRLEVLSLSHNRLVGRIPDGTQFNTFDENSFEGNAGLCGFPLPKRCSKYTQKPQLEARKDHEEESGFTWEVVMLGYGCGTLVGLVMGYFMLSTRKVKWFNAIADATESLVLKKKRRHVCIRK